MSDVKTANMNPLVGAIDARSLMRKEFPPQVELVPGMLVSGTVMLVAAPKIGKSWMVLGLALAASEGREAFGCIAIKARPVLYLALEDGERRLQSRLRSLGAVDLSENLSFITDPQADVCAALGAFLAVHKTERPLVILDTLGKVLPSMPMHGNESHYEHDYRVISGFKAIVDSCYGATLIIVHHTRKMGSEDAVDTVSGTNGIAGAADAVMALKRDRNNDRGTLFVTSRDAPEGEYAMTFDNAGVWRLVGGSLASASQKLNTERLIGNLSDMQRSIMKIVQEHPQGVKATQIVELLGDGTPRAKVDSYLNRLLKAQKICKPKRGVYVPLPMDNRGDEQGVLGAPEV